MSSRALTSLLAALVLAAGCGSAAADEPAPPASQPPTELRVSFRPSANAEAVRATLTCDPVGGTHPQADAACRALAAHAGALEPVAADVACTEIYGGPEKAVVEGTLAGRRVRASFSRENGCEIDRWDRLEPLFRLGVVSK